MATIRQRMAATKRARVTEARSRKTASVYGRAGQLARVAGTLHKAGFHKDAERMGAKAQRLYAGASRSGRLAGPVGRLPNNSTKRVWLTLPEDTPIARLMMKELKELRGQPGRAEYVRELIKRLDAIERKALKKNPPNTNEREFSKCARCAGEIYRWPGKPWLHSLATRDVDHKAMRRRYAAVTRAANPKRFPTDNLVATLRALFPPSESDSEVASWLLERVKPQNAKVLMRKLGRKWPKDIVITRETNPLSVDEWDIDEDWDNIVEQGHELGAAAARAIGHSQREHRSRLKLFSVSYYSPIRDKRLTFMRPIEAHNQTDAIRQAKAMVTNEKKPVNFTAREVKKNRSQNSEIRTQNPTVYGTSYFVSRAAAVRYYTDYYPDRASANRGVERKIAEGEIHVGKPPYNASAGERLITIDGGKRYGVKKNPGIVDLAAGLQAAEYLGGLGKKRKRNAAASNPLYAVKQMPDGRWKVYERRGKGGRQEWFITAYNTEREARRDVRERNANYRDTGQSYKRNPSGAYKRGMRDGLADEQTSWRIVVSGSGGLRGQEREDYLKGFADGIEKRIRTARRKRNPSLRSLSETFQGNASGAVKELKAANAAPANLARVGRLVFFNLAATRVRVPGAVVAMDTREKLWLAGATAPMFTKRAAKGQRLDYGPITRIVYETSKTHIESGKRTEYDHEFEKPYPRLHIDDEGMPIISGGKYRITAAGIEG